MNTNGQSGRQEQRPPAIDESYARARDAFTRRDFAGAIPLCRQILEAEPDSVPAFNLLAAALNRSGGIGDEIAALKSAIDSGGDSPMLYAKLGELQRVAGDTGSAIASLERATAGDPDNPVIRLRLGMAHYKADAHAAAEKAFARVLELDPGSAPAHYFIGNIRWYTGNWPAARKAFAAALECDTGYPPACLNLAEILFYWTGSEDRTADLEQAAGLAQRAVENGADDYYSHLLFFSRLLAGKILIELNRYEEAKNILEPATGYTDKHHDLYVALSLIYGKLNKIDKARSITQRFMREFPTGSRVCASPEAQVLVLEHFNNPGLDKPFYGAKAYAYTNAISALPPDRVSLHHSFIQGINRDQIDTYNGRYDVIFNNAANAEINLQRGYSEKIQYIADHAGLPVINPPGPMDLTTRGGNYERLREIDHLVFPKTVAVTPDADSTAGIMERAEAGFEFPVLVRRAGGHRATELVKADDMDALREALVRFAGEPCYIIQFHDSRHSGGSFLRYRGIFIADKFLPGRMSLSESWLVGASSKRTGEKKLIEGNSELQDEEKRWLGDPAGAIGQANIAALQALNDVIGLDCYGVDFGLLKDGRVIVFEANACMNILSILRHVRKYPYLEQAAGDIKSAFEDLLIGRARGRA